MTLRRIVALVAVVAAGVVTLLASGPGVAEANAPGCGSGTHGSPGYAYAGHQATDVAHGVRATITPIARPVVRSGHVAGWVGVGGPGQGANGETAWVQIGVASLPGAGPMVYTEITRPGADPAFVPLVQEVAVGESHQVAVLEMHARPDWWRVWLDGQPVTEPIHLPRSSNRWQPIVTAESYTGAAQLCNAFGFRFEGVGVARALGGSWRTFRPGYAFLDRGLAVRPLRPVADERVRTLSSDPIRAYAFDAASS